VLLPVPWSRRSAAGCFAEQNIGGAKLLQTASARGKRLASRRDLRRGRLLKAGGTAAGGTVADGTLSVREGDTMKAFGVAVLFVLVMALGASVVLEGMLSHNADDAFARSSVRVGEGGSIEQRHFSGK
jgi:hypothetical protein